MSTSRERMFSQTQQLPHYSTLAPSRNALTPYRPRKAPHPEPGCPSVLPLRRFQEYFGKMKPAFFQEIRNIFEHSSIEERSPSPEEQDCQIRGKVLSTRGRLAGKKRESNIERWAAALAEPSHFTIDSMNVKDIFRKAKLNQIIRYRETLQERQLSPPDTSDAGSPVEPRVPVPPRPRNPTPTLKATFRVSRSETDSLLHQLNPHSQRGRFTSADLISAVCLLHRVHVSLPSVSFFNVYVEEGNNAELVKNLVRRRSGWRVVEIPDIANFIWTQFYRRGVLQKRLNKRQKTEHEEEDTKESSCGKLAALIKQRMSARKGECDPESSAEREKESEAIFTSELRKLVPVCEVEDVKKMRSVSSKLISEISVNSNLLVHNHFPENRCISDKKNLLSHITNYHRANAKDPFEFLPETYHLHAHTHPILDRLAAAHDNDHTHWIVKPGENSNRGRGIVVCHSSKAALEELTRRLGEPEPHPENPPLPNPTSGETSPTPCQIRQRPPSTILQKYLRPLLYESRKFDIRSYMLVTLLQGQLRMYCYEECYIRTSSKHFDMESSSRMVHLTNDAVQAHSQDYGRYEEGNKLGEGSFGRWLDEEGRRAGRDWAGVRREMERQCVAVMEASWKSLVRGCGSEHFYFELFGMDFMIDHCFKVWLIEVNTNPAITHDCSRVLNHLIPRMLDNLLTLAVEPLMRPTRLPEAPFTNQFVAAYRKDIP